MSNQTLESVLSQLQDYELDEISSEATHITIDSNGDIFSWFGEPEFIGKDKAWLGGGVDSWVGIADDPDDASI